MPEAMTGWWIPSTQTAKLTVIRVWKRLRVGPSPILREVMSEEVVGGQFDGFLWRDQC